jgi:LacI family transcriptional regulator
LNYFPNLAARQLRRGKSKTKTLGLLINDITNPFYALVVRATQECAARRGYQTLVSDSQWLAKKEIAEVQMMVESRVDGVLACFCEKTKRSLELLDTFSIPFLALDTYPADYKGGFVANDIAEAARLGAEHMIERGCRQLVFLTADAGMDSFSAFKIMMRTFSRVVRSHGLPFPEERIIRSGLTIDAGVDAFDRVMAAVPEVDGVFSVNALCALGFMEGADRQRISIKGRMAVMGVDDLDICRLSRISLTSIRQPYRKLAQMATDLLIDSIERKTAPSASVALKPELIVRDSTWIVKLPAP